MRQIRVALAQMNATVGDLAGNTAHIVTLIRQAAHQSVDLVVFPELALTGYPPEDLLFKRQFLDDASDCLIEIANASSGLVAVVGTPHVGKEALFNSAAIVYDGQIVDFYHKIHLPNYGVFDEGRYFEPGQQSPIYVINGVIVGVNICEDLWYEMGPTTAQAASGAELIVNISASPYYRSRGTIRHDMIAARATEHSVHLAYVNLVGGQDELVFDGQSLIFNPDGKLLVRGPQFKEELLVADLDVPIVEERRLPQSNYSGVPDHSFKIVHEHQAFHIFEFREKENSSWNNPVVHEPLGKFAEIYEALVLGTRDYVSKSGFGKVLIGLSGGIDSALTTVLAVDALGSENVTAVFMPSRYTSDASKIDAQQLADNLGIKLHTIPIDDTYDAYIEALGPVFQGYDPDVTEENIQARIRGNLLMALSNKSGSLVLTTGNKSEMATGYCTLYGDMAGGFAVLKDVPKTLVQSLSRHCNNREGTELIPESILTKAPSAELRLNQKDEDSLPPYETLDPILEAYVEEDLTIEDMIGRGLPPEEVAQAIRLVDQSEYKRRQSPPGVKITPRAFGRDRRLPTVNRYKPI